MRFPVIHTSCSTLIPDCTWNWHVRVILVNKLPRYFVCYFVFKMIRAHYFHSKMSIILNSFNYFPSVWIYCKETSTLPVAHMCFSLYLFSLTITVWIFLWIAVISIFWQQETTTLGCIGTSNLKINLNCYAAFKKMYLSRWKEIM